MPVFKTFITTDCFLHFVHPCEHKGNANTRGENYEYGIGLIYNCSQSAVCEPKRPKLKVSYRRAILRLCRRLSSSRSAHPVIKFACPSDAAIIAII